MNIVTLVSGTRKFDRGLSRLLHVDLHWLDVPERVQYKLGRVFNKKLSYRRERPRATVSVVETLKGSIIGITQGHCMGLGVVPSESWVRFPIRIP